MLQILFHLDVERLRLCDVLEETQRSFDEFRPLGWPLFFVRLCSVFWIEITAREWTEYAMRGQGIRRPSFAQAFGDVSWLSGLDSGRSQRRRLKHIVKGIACLIGGLG